MTPECRFVNGLARTSFFREDRYDGLISKTNLSPIGGSTSYVQNVDHEQYQYAELDEDRSRYSIDPNWYGELPRTYFYDATHQISPLSGKISNSFLNAWLKK